MPHCPGWSRGAEQLQGWVGKLREVVGLGHPEEEPQGPQPGLSAHHLLPQGLHLECRRERVLSTGQPQGSPHGHCVRPHLQAIGGSKVEADPQVSSPGAGYPAHTQPSVLRTAVLSRSTTLRVLGTHSPHPIKQVRGLRSQGFHSAQPGASAWTSGCSQHSSLVTLTAGNSTGSK